MKILSHCPGCDHGKLSPPWTLPREPVVLNYRCATPAAALRIPRKDLRLAQCSHCGLIFNSEPDAGAVPYDDRYENRQCFSPAFLAHLQSVADTLIDRYSLKGGRILEIGCGKGDFIKLICARAQATGVGFDTTYEGSARCSRPPISFYRRYASAGDLVGTFDALICRHVVEHVPEIGKFLTELNDMARAAKARVVLLETPTFEWIVRHGCFWDVFFEHCNYFTKPCMAYLCQRAGFVVQRQTTTFGGQYQLLELRVRRKPLIGLRAPGAKVRMAAFAGSATLALRGFENRLASHGAKAGWAIWGAGAKGVALANRLRRPPPQFVVDTNAAKQGGYIPGTRIPIIAPSDPRLLPMALVMIANPNYKREITLALRQAGFANTILTA